MVWEHERGYLSKRVPFDTSQRKTDAGGGEQDRMKEEHLNQGLSSLPRAR
jgi:hypothetical protein